MSTDVTTGRETMPTTLAGRLDTAGEFLFRSAAKVTVTFAGEKIGYQVVKTGTQLVSVYDAETEDDALASLLQGGPVKIRGSVESINGRRSMKVQGNVLLDTLGL